MSEELMSCKVRLKEDITGTRRIPSQFRGEPAKREEYILRAETVGIVFAIHVPAPAMSGPNMPENSVGVDFDDDTRAIVRIDQIEVIARPKGKIRGKIRTINGMPARFCSSACCSGYKTDRKCGLIYSPWEVASVRMGVDNASISAGFCAYCNEDLTPTIEEEETANVKV